MQAMNSHAVALPKLDFLWLELTNRCNLQCGHCYSDSSPHTGHKDVLLESDYKRLIDESSAMGCTQIQFIGGEPTLNKSLPSLINHAAHSGFNMIEVFTNLIQLDDALLQNWHTNGVSVASSFYSYEPTTHDLITNSFGSFKRTVANIKKVLAAGIELRVGVIEMPANAGHYPRTVEFLRGIGVKCIDVDHVREFGRAQTRELCEMGELCGDCAGNILAVGPDGVVAPCIMSKQWSVGSVLDTSLTSIAASEALSATRKLIAASRPQVQENNCQPNNPYNCVPNQSCLPCAPNGGHKCIPNGNCIPGK